MTKEQFRAVRTEGGAPGLGMTQSAMGEFLGVASNTVARWEAGRLPIPRWAERMIALRDDLADTKMALAREQASNERLRERYRRLTLRIGGKASRKR
jgi:DNA-binding XRE family transcriptional regulator